MKKINLSITGCMGRMGRQIIKSLKNNRNFKLVSLTESKIINKKVAGIKPGLNNVESFKNTNIIIDFTVPKCTLEILKIAAKLKKGV
ncbi:4-hydroxy-tetrahydrodipicolinate reductase, partial [Pelagibacteraceae bacterium]|nr:4-hydroxy-tetrahydrodipicolinate reductase [Pelagibacteraceae bacterium]